MANYYAVYVKGATNDEPLYRNYSRDTYKQGEIIALFGDDLDLAKQFADSFKGYYKNIEADVCGVHQSARVGDDYSTFWAEQLPEPVKNGWIEYLDSLNQDEYC